MYFRWLFLTLFNCYSLYREFDDKIKHSLQFLLHSAFSFVFDTFSTNETGTREAANNNKRTWGILLFLSEVFCQSSIRVEEYEARIGEPYSLCIPRFVWPIFYLAVQVIYHLPSLLTRSFSRLWASLPILDISLWPPEPDYWWNLSELRGRWLNRPLQGGDTDLGKLRQ